jgi:dUTP pyrophosphatase
MIDKLKDLGSLRDMSDKLEQMLRDNNADELSLDKIYDEFGLDIKKLDEEMRNYKPKLYLGFNKLHPDATTPKYNYAGDSGFDLHSVEDIEIGPFGRALIPTGLSFNIKDGYEIQVRSKSGLAINQGLMVLNSPGTVDNSYTGEIKVILFNTNNYIVTIPKGMKVAQAVLCPVVNGGWVDLDEVDDINNKERGSRGFGSTGLFV